MNGQQQSRRNFLLAAAGGAAGLSLAGAAARLAEAAEPLVIEEPFHGAVLNRRLGTQTPDGLRITVRGRAPLGVAVSVNGTPARRAGQEFTAEVTLREKETDIVAVAEGSYGRQQHRVRVVWDKNSFPRYRFAIDDNIYFLRDIARKKYKSLFDCFYLRMLRDLHSRYGTKFVLNLFYAAEDGFTLKQFPDRYKGEWQDNAGWLKLAFHAYSDEPARPYQYASASQVLADFDRVAEEIHRFAGDETYSPTTITHWAMLQPSVLPGLVKRGVRVLSGYFRRAAGGWDINYMLDDARSEYLSRNDALKDFATGIVFTKVDLVCNHLPSIERVIPTLEPLVKDPRQAEIMDLATHEQPFWRFWRGYLPDHAQRVERAIRWVTEHGYKPVFFHEGFIGAPA